ncbi:hypothetical protein [Achromobacter anxifer]|jgi:hypothetical protein|uniref:hypothetical protein n=1 Tax=Achromobacter anxifer TaxID=1287737 RepID=UPI0023F7518F|nr:hypothetical protein [Achromobacter anxifer]MDF8359921.1 hypothetical protein [Achromobacter anxifer]
MERLPQALLLELPGAGRTLAFGLRWFALIGSNVPALARSRGRRLRASHYVVGGAPAAVAGFGRLRSSWRGAPRAGRRQTHFLAAAQLYALLYPEGGHSLIRLPDGGHWLVAAQRGTVLSQTDRVFASLDDALREQAHLRAQWPALPAQDADEAWAALLQGAESAARLVALPTRWGELPLAFRLFLVCLGLAAVAPTLWNTVVTSLSGRQAPAQAGDADLPQQQDPYLVLLRNTATHAPSELTRLLASLGMLPIQVRGWALGRARCLAGDQAWTCAASYVRAHPLAANDVLHALLPPGWQLSFQPLEEATLSWRVESRQERLADVSLPAALQVDTVQVVALQRMRPAFASISLAAAVPLTLPPPPLPSAPVPPVANQAAVAYPARPAIRRRSIILRGPLRSFALLPGAIHAARWARLSLDIQPQPRPSLAASTLVAELQGELYEHE